MPLAPTSAYALRIGASACLATPSSAPPTACASACASSHPFRTATAVHGSCVARDGRSFSNSSISDAWFSILPATCFRCTLATSSTPPITNSCNGEPGEMLKSPARHAGASSLEDSAVSASHTTLTCASFTSPRFGLKSTCMLATQIRRRCGLLSWSALSMSTSTSKQHSCATLSRKFRSLRRRCATGSTGFTERSCHAMASPSGFPPVRCTCTHA